MFSANYHTHTKRCGHAIGEDEEYVVEAIGHGLRYLGFSDHIMLPGFSEPYKRGEYDMMDDYLTSIRDLSKQYSEQIKIYVGFEAESFPCYFTFYHEMLENHIFDYLILGNHCAMDDNHNIYSRFSHISSASQLYEYKELAIKAIATGMFKIFAHPDYFMQSIENFDADCKKVSREMIEACIAYDVPLEINLAGIRNGERQVGKEKRWWYPHDEFFKLVSKYKAKCIFGSDAHAPNQIYDETANYEAVYFAKKHDLIILDKLDTIR